MNQILKIKEWLSEKQFDENCKKVQAAYFTLNNYLEPGHIMYVSQKLWDLLFIVYGYDFSDNPNCKVHPCLSNYEFVQGTKNFNTLLTTPRIVYSYNYTKIDQ